MTAALASLRQIVSADKSVDSRLLNRLGAQVLRTIAAHAAHEIRPWDVHPTIRPEAEELDREGILLWPDFLPSADFAHLERECVSRLEDESISRLVFKHGPNTLDVLVLGQDEGLPATRRLMEDPRLLVLLEAAEKRTVDPRSGHRALERLVQGTMNAEVDPESSLHSDIFFPCHKAWLYLSDVQMEHGPFAYVKRSHRLSLTQLRHVYEESTTRNAGSRRISASEFTQLGLAETVVTCPKNTLVIANVTGFHRRLRGQPGCRRYAVHINLRVSPFTSRRHHAGPGN